MKIILTGSLGNIGKPLTQELVEKGHTVTVISSKTERQKDIEAMGATAAIGTMQDADFLSATFKGADIVYLMEAWEGIGSIFDHDVGFVAAFNHIGQNYKYAVEQSGVKRIVHLSSIGAHTDKGTSSLFLHNTVENILKQLQRKAQRALSWEFSVWSIGCRFNHKEHRGRHEGHRVGSTEFSVGSIGCRFNRKGQRVQSFQFSVGSIGCRFNHKERRGRHKVGRWSKFPTKIFLAFLGG